MAKKQLLPMGWYNAAKYTDQPSMWVGNKMKNQLLGWLLVSAQATTGLLKA